MTRKMLTATMVVTALLLSVLSLGGLTQEAEAQGNETCPYDLAIIVADARKIEGNEGFTVRNGRYTIPCATALAYPGPFSNMPTTPGGPYGFGTKAPVAAADATIPAATTTPGAGLAHTGSESAVLAYAGAGLIAFGAVAMGSRRKFFQGALED